MNTTEHYEYVIQLVKRHGELLTKSVNNRMTDQEKKEFEELWHKFDELTGDTQ